MTSTPTTGESPCPVAGLRFGREGGPAPGQTHTRTVPEELSDAILENAYSRIYLGVHWRYDAAAASDILDGNGQLRPEPVYGDVWPARADGAYPTGGVPLGLGIANDIFAHGLTRPGPTPTLTATSALSESVSKRSNTNIR